MMATWAGGGTEEGSVAGVGGGVGKSSVLGWREGTGQTLTRDLLPVAGSG
jgi:hypothetical protein